MFTHTPLDSRLHNALKPCPRWGEHEERIEDIFLVLSGDPTPLSRTLLRFLSNHNLSKGFADWVETDDSFENLLNESQAPTHGDDRINRLLTQGVTTCVVSNLALKFLAGKGKSDEIADHLAILLAEGGQEM